MYFLPFSMPTYDYALYQTEKQQYHDLTVAISQKQNQLRELAETQERISLDIQEKERILSQLEEKNRQLEERNRDLMEQQGYQAQNSRRRYTKRRRNLSKDIRCQFMGCKAKFSSDMALRNHNRIKHNIRKRVSNDGTCFY